MAHEDYKDMLPALALSALDADDARALNQHLSECDECRRELADWESTAAALALSADPAEPSPQVRDRIMTAVRSEKHATQASRVVPFPPARRSTWSSFGLIGAVAAAVALVVLILWIVVLWQENRNLRRSNQELATEIHSMDRSNRFVEILSTPGAKVTQLQGNGPGSGAIAQLVHDRAGRAVLLANNLPPTPAGKEYQLWFIVGKNPPIPGRTFATDDLGRGALTDDVPQQALDSAVFAVTLEPLGGSSAPTSAIYLRGGL
jgi:anti-sigma-K factor RskA